MPDTKKNPDLRTKFHDLFNITEVQKLQNNITEATGMSAIIVLPNGESITKPTGALDLTHFSHYWINVIAEEPQSRTIILPGDGPMLAISPILFDDQLIGNWLLGQTLSQEQSMSATYNHFEFCAKHLFASTEYFNWVAQQQYLLTQEISALKAREAEILYLSYHDVLTGVYNRRYFESALVKIDDELNLPITLVMGDLNGLKLVNDSFGHSTGDQLLVQCARDIQSVLRANDIIARLGGDEFVFILPKTDSNTAEDLINRVKTKLQNHKIEGVTLSVAFGSATKIFDHESITEVLKTAEELMYRNKIFMRSTISNGIIDMIMTTLFEKNAREMLHCSRVGRLSRSLALAMALPEESLKRIYITGLMHDIGKIGINESILNSELGLTVEQWQEIKKHPDIGFRILSASNEFYDLAIDVLQHHERWDGQGYPKGLAREDISLNARIIAIADTFDALTSDRAYRKALTYEEAVNEMKRCSGTQFDPDLLEVFLDVVALQQ